MRSKKPQKQRETKKSKQKNTNANNISDRRQYITKALHNYFHILNKDDHQTHISIASYEYMCQRQMNCCAVTGINLLPLHWSAFERVGFIKKDPDREWYTDNVEMVFLPIAYAITKYGPGVYLPSGSQLRINESKSDTIKSLWELVHALMSILSKDPRVRKIPICVNDSYLGDNLSIRLYYFQHSIYPDHYPYIKYRNSIRSEHHMVNARSQDAAFTTCFDNNTVSMYSSPRDRIVLSISDPTFVQTWLNMAVDRIHMSIRHDATVKIHGHNYTGSLKEHPIPE
jgi:hypothetical protein